MIGNEIKTVKFFSENAHIQRHREFHEEAQRVFGQYRNRPRGFAFASHLDFFHSGMAKKRGTTSKEPNVRLIIAAGIDQERDGSYENISQVLVVCRLHAKRSAILRKFHFDATVKPNKHQSQPISHMQYCGEMLPVMKNLKYGDEQLKQLYPKVREPRIFFWPMSLALLVDMVFREFGDKEFKQKILPDPGWRKLIRSNEELLLKPFFKECMDTITNADEKRETLAERFYLG